MEATQETLQSVETWTKLILGSGGVLTLLLVAVKWLASALQKEQSERISLLEKHSLQCSNDRIQLHGAMTSLQNEVRTLYKSIIAGKFDKSFFDEVHIRTNEQRNETGTGT